MRKKLFPTARPVHTVPCMCVPPRPVPWATWHSAELTHATRVASHRARAQSTQSSPPAADGNWSTTCFCAFSRTPLAVGLAMQLLMDGRTEGHVVRALTNMIRRYGKTEFSFRVNSYGDNPPHRPPRSGARRRRSLTLYYSSSALVLSMSCL